MSKQFDTRLARERRRAMKIQRDRLNKAAPDLLAACKLMYRAWEALLPNLKNGVVQDYELVLTTAPSACTAAIRKAEGTL